MNRATKGTWRPYQPHVKPGCHGLSAADFAKREASQHATARRHTYRHLPHKNKKPDPAKTESGFITTLNNRQMTRAASSKRTAVHDL